jgi:putative transposase
MQMR